MLDSIAGKVTLVADGQVLGEEEYRREEDENRPDDLSLVLGMRWAFFIGNSILDVNRIPSEDCPPQCLQLSLVCGEDGGVGKGRRGGMGSTRSWGSRQLGGGRVRQHFRLSICSYFG